jgi:uncharacterized membrane protein YidH (DUF202 family)
MIFKIVIYSSEHGFLFYLFHGGFQTLTVKPVVAAFAVIIGSFIIINVIGFIGRQSVMKEFEPEKYISTGRKLVFLIRLVLLVVILCTVILFAFIVWFKGNLPAA